MQNKINDKVHDVWVYLLQQDEQKIHNAISFHDKMCQLFPVNFEIVEKMGTGMERVLADWNEQTRTIRMSINLLKNFPWDAVTYVLRHEIAHQIVSEYFHAESIHGDGWKLACKMTEAEPEEKSYLSKLSQMGNTDVDPIVSKIKKLLAKGKDSAVTEDEANIFLTKAEELIRIHNVSLNGENKIYVKRPITSFMKKFPNWAGIITNMIGKFYNIRSISIQKYVNNQYVSYCEFFGEAHNVDVAEYIFHAICNHGEIEYRKYLKQKAIEFKATNSYGRQPRASKISFMNGLVNGYREKLNKQKECVEIHANALILANDSLLSDMFKKAYPDARLGQKISFRGQGREAGYNAGKNLNINAGVRGCGVRQLN